MIRGEGEGEVKGVRGKGRWGYGGREGREREEDGAGTSIANYNGKPFLRDDHTGTDSTDTTRLHIISTIQM